jgi:hypothetical protein
MGYVEQKNLVKMMFLECDNDDEINELMNRLRNVDISSTITSLKQKALIIETDDGLTISPEKQEQLLKSKSKKIIGISRPLALELTWTGYFIPLIKQNSWDKFYSILLRNMKDNKSIKIITDASSFLDEKIEMTFRIFKIATRLVIRKNSFSIESRSSIPDIPITEGVDNPLSIIENMPRDKDTFPTMTAPNLFANYFLYSLLKRTLKELDKDYEPFVQISLPHLSPLIGEDVYQNNE